ncbi:exonuclease [Curvibacter phage P26059B]|uniref:DNA exonuclease n=1 Tax=Curvibacter phage P26059B TaxID=1983784 RepID=A0A384UXW7_9CAUD|nr:exonuclease [Curvibacter phage P26059B]ASJ79300.1 DNA exonuclease [Curvibacter phage P26059B]
MKGLDLKALGAKAAAAQPMGYGSVPVVHQRTLLVDGDGLCYYCAGNDDTDIGTARRNLIDKVRRATELVGAGQIKILVTGAGSHKGHRYAIARAKPYQGQRAGSRRPKNWQGLRDLLDTGFPGVEIETTYTAEADDLFGFYAYNDPDNTVILTQDKDMRMLPGTHLDWVTNRVHVVEHGLATVRQEHIMYNRTVVDSVFNDKQYGPKWFWLQMLHGDTADNIPGLPKYVVDDKAKPVGEVTAAKFLANRGHLGELVYYFYASYYGKRALVEMLEQACLLWMRRDPNNWADCAEYGGPMYQFTDHEYWPAAYAEIEQRVRQADELNAIQT